jgi:HlyD family secretion protein
MTQLNGNHQNGNSQNGSQTERTRILTNPRDIPQDLPRKPLRNFNEDNLEQAVVLRQSPFWSRTILISLIGLAIAGITWAYFAKIEQVIPAIGQFKPEGTVKEIQAPINGVVKAIYVKEGQKVQPGDLLLTFDSFTTLAELSSLNKIRLSITQEDNTYRRLLGDTNYGMTSRLDLFANNLPPENISLLKSRAALVQENNLLRAQLKNQTTGVEFDAEEKTRLESAKKELDSRAAAADLTVKESQKQLAETQVKRRDTEYSLQIQKQVLSGLHSLAVQGGVSKLQYLNQLQQVENLQAEIDQLIEEEKRLRFDIKKGEQNLTNTVANTDKTTLEKIADNKKRIAEIDSQFMKIIVDNEQKLADVNSKISQAQTNFKYEELRAPVGGTVFDLQAKNPGYVANTTQKLLDIVPKENLVGEVFITNKDIGFVRKGMKVDVRIDSFPFSEFGDIKGEITEIGSDALPPDENHKFYRFPAKVHLDKQYLPIQGREISLQSGMSISANIKVRENRTVMSLFTELFSKQTESLKEVR